MDLNFPALALLAVTFYPFSEIQLISANKTVPCNKTSCKDFEFCDLSTGKCHPDIGDCRTESCKEGQYCSDYGKCIEDTPCNTKCPEGEECYLQRVQCFQAPCPPLESCRPRKCGTPCQDGQLCEDGECVEDPRCASATCLEGTVCYNGACFTKVPCETDWKPEEKCYEGSEVCEQPPCPKKVIRRFDKCSIVRCRGEDKCVNGKCVPKGDGQS